MPHRPLLALSLLAMSLLASSLTTNLAQAQSEAYTTRIEPRAYYGAVVTLEQGVRVWRPLPPTRHMIINPDGRTPLNLTVEDVRHTTTNHNYVQGSTDTVNGGGYGGPSGYYGRSAGRHHGHRGHRHAVRGLSPRSASGGSRR